MYEGVYDTLKATFILCVLMVVLVLFSGCSLAPEAVKREAARGVTKYCDTFTYEQRVGVLRPEFNSLIAPHKAQVNCFGDPENPKPATKAQADASK